MPVCISERQRDVHVAGETLALVFVVPFMGYLATRRELPTWARVSAAAVGVGSLLLDGYVLSQFLKR